MDVPEGKEEGVRAPQSADIGGEEAAASMAEAETTLRRRRGQLRLKRAADVLIGALGLALCSPLFALIAAAIALDDDGPVFYRQERVGRDGKPFRILKFRTMVRDADRKGLPLTVGADARITRVGRFLRRTKLDELAQLVNVLRGDMSLVGPRPEVPRYVALYTPVQRLVLRVRPGITDPASIAYRDENALLAHSADPERDYVERVMPAKLAINLDYLLHFTLWGDLLLLVSTLVHLCRDAIQRGGQSL
jgi:lipopolysaccharide/colanic/teichoic acid biosynthesis glycosyltransferase